MITLEEKLGKIKKDPISGLRLPEFKIEERYYKEMGVDSSISNSEFLKVLCRKGFKDKGVGKFPNKQEYVDRIKRELSLFDELGYTDYFLLIWDIVNFARVNDIAVGVGRGSGVSSLTLYFLGITGVDPIKYGLLFERFVSKARAKSQVIDGIRYFDGDLPDVDIDFCFVNRSRIIDYIKERFSGKTCKILTVGTLQGKACIKEVCKVAGGYAEEDANVVSSKIDKVSGKVQHISKAIEEGLSDWVNEKRQEYRHQDNRTIAEIATKIEGLPKNFGVHASAMGVSCKDLEGYCPIQLTKDGELISGYTKDDVEQMLVKVDVLGLKTMTILDCLSKSTGVKLSDIDVEDPKLYEAIRSWGNYTYGLFQLEGYAANRALNKVLPENLNDVSAINGLARPGAMSFIDEYSDRKNGHKQRPRIYPSLDKITDDTHGIIIYQEQVMKAFNEVFGFSLEDAEVIRRVIGKKKTEEVKVWKPRVLEAGIKNGIPESVTEDFWKVVEDSSNYSFNKCLHPETLVETPFGKKELKDVVVGDSVLAFDTKSGKDHYVIVKNIHESFVDLYEVGLEDGKRIKTSLDHRFLTNSGMVKMHRVMEESLEVVVKL